MKRAYSNRTSAVCGVLLQVLIGSVSECFVAGAVEGGSAEGAGDGSSGGEARPRVRMIVSESGRWCGDALVQCSR